VSGSSHQLVQELWNYYNILSDDGLSYGDYVEQLTFSAFPQDGGWANPPTVQQVVADPQERQWASLMRLDGNELETHYRHVLESLGKEKSMLGVIFRKAQNKIEDSAKLRGLIADLIDKEQWSSLSADVKGDAYEELLQKNAEDVKGGAGQYFTLRPLITAIVDVMRPEPKMTICKQPCR
jgi:type I restriction enzyme M protein